MIPNCLRLFVAVTVIGATLPARAAIQKTGPAETPRAIRSVAGQDLFEFYCASCHGRSGKGDGPAAIALKVPPPNLTTIAKRNGNIFPKARLEAFVTNDTVDRVTAHGTRDMPVWGPIFMSLDPSDTMTRIRIANVVTYIQSLQQK